jgi:cytidylate kinase
MSEKTLSSQMSELRISTGESLEKAGPFIAISREYGCGGFSLGLLLLDLLNDEVDDGRGWQIYHKEILQTLASETNLAMEIIERQRRDRPNMLMNFFKTLSGQKDHVPSGMEIRKRMTSIIRELAVEGRAILIGQGSTGAVADLPRGLTVRLEAPEDWRVKQVAFREGLSEIDARKLIREETERRDYLRKIYERKFVLKSAFSMTFDCSKFSLSQIAMLIYRAMKLKDWVR